MPLILHYNGKTITTLTGFGAVDSHGEAKHAVFYYMLLFSEVVDKWAIVLEDFFFYWMTFFYRHLHKTNINLLTITYGYIDITTFTNLLTSTLLC